jgi:hypothetical protein
LLMTVTMLSREGAASRHAQRVTSFYRGTQVDFAAIGEYLPQLPGTRKENQAGFSHPSDHAKWSVRVSLPQQ